MRTERFRHDRDLLAAVLSDTDDYTIKEAQKLIDNYRKQEV